MGSMCYTIYVYQVLDGPVCVILSIYFRYLMGQYVTSHGDVISHVNVSSVQVSDGGTYTCTADNTAGVVTHSARLNVYGPPTVRSMGELTAVAGEVFSVTCPVGGHPIHKITWSKGKTYFYIT